MLLHGGGALLCTSVGAAVSSGSKLSVPNSADAFASIQGSIERIHRQGGGELKLAAGKTFRCRRAPIVLDGVTLNLNGATLELSLSDGNDQGVRLRSGATLCGGTIRVLSHGSPSLQAGAHAPVCIGPLYGEGGTAASPSPDEGVKGWTLRDLVLASDKRVLTPTGPIGAVAIQISGGANNGLIERITIPDSETLSGAVHLDWGVIGPIKSADDLLGLEANRRAFDAGIGWTTHPHDIVIRDIRVGRLSGGQGGPDGGADAIRLSGCRSVAVSHVRATATSGVFVRHTAGDLGLEYAAPEAVDINGNYFSKCSVDDCLDGRLFVSDSMADNVARGMKHGYRPRRPVILPTDIVFDRVEGHGRGKADGGLFVQQQGGRATRCRAQRFAVGFRCDAATQAVELAYCVATNNRVTGFLVEHVGEPPRDCKLITPVAIDNGADPASGANITVGASVGTTIEGGTIGNSNRTDHARYGIWIKERRDGCVDATITGTPLINSHAEGGAAFRVSSEEGWGALRLFTGARYGNRITRRWIGLSIVPTSIDATGRILTISPSARIPRAFPGRIGDRFVTGWLG